VQEIIGQKRLVLFRIFTPAHPSLCGKIFYSSMKKS